VAVSFRYAGVGARATPYRVCQRMTAIAVRLQARGYTLRSGGAVGADQAFEAGAGEAKEIFRPEDATEEAMAIAASVHPAWDRCSPIAKRLHGRNAFQVLGRTLDDPSDFVVCWTADGTAIGGTATAIRIAELHGIPVFNLHDPAAIDRLAQIVQRNATAR
jgi:hypothetical protein